MYGQGTRLWCIGLTIYANFKPCIMNLCKCMKHLIPYDLFSLMHGRYHLMYAYSPLCSSCRTAADLSGGKCVRVCWNNAAIFKSEGRESRTIATHEHIYRVAQKWSLNHYTSFKSFPLVIGFLVAITMVTHAASVHRAVFMHILEIVVNITTGTEPYWP